MQVQPNEPLPPLNDQDVEPLWELATSTDERLRLRFVQLALDDQVLTRRLKDRAPFAFQAAVGLDPTRRTRVPAQDLIRGGAADSTQGESVSSKRSYFLGFVSAGKSSAGISPLRTAQNSLKIRYSVV